MSHRVQGISSTILPIELCPTYKWCSVQIGAMMPESIRHTHPRFGVVMVKRARLVRDLMKRIRLISVLPHHPKHYHARTYEADHANGLPRRCIEKTLSFPSQHPGQATYRVTKSLCFCLVQSLQFMQGGGVGESRGSLTLELPEATAELAGRQKKEAEEDPLSCLVSGRWSPALMMIIRTPASHSCGFSIAGRTVHLSPDLDVPLYFPYSPPFSRPLRIIFSWPGTAGPPFRAEGTSRDETTSSVCPPWVSASCI